jgi:hypothetical protein
MVFHVLEITSHFQVTAAPNKMLGLMANAII